jgi:hypothetical protein
VSRSHPDSDRKPARVAAVLQQVRAGIRQRQGELASIQDDCAQIQLRLDELRQAVVVQEPTCVSPRPVIGRLIVQVRSLGFHLFGKWYAHSLLQQQNEFNRLAADLMEDLAVEQQRLASRLRVLVRELERSSREEETDPS